MRFGLDARLAFYDRGGIGRYIHCLAAAMTQECAADSFSPIVDFRDGGWPIGTWPVIGPARSTRLDWLFGLQTAALGLDLTVFVMIRTRHHARDWVDRFSRHVQSLPEVIDFNRIGGEWDYLLKIVTPGMAGYDRFYQKLIDGFDFDKVTGLFSMEQIFENRPTDLNRLL